MHAISVQVGDVLKRFAAKVTTSSVKERVQICDSVATCVRSEGELSARGYTETYRDYRNPFYWPYGRRAESTVGNK